MEEKAVFSGENVEEAIAAGLAALGLIREQVEIEILDEGSRGALGIGARPARVRLSPIPAPAPQPTGPPTPEPPTPPAEPDPTEVARGVLAELLERMGFAAGIHTHQAEPAPDEEEGPLVLDVRGPGVDALIGRRGETLAALQRIVRLIVGRRMAERVNLVVDVDGFKQRRERNLRRLATRMAERAAQSGQTVALEPMSAYERRIVHLALRDRTDVRTESVGTGYRRRVTIIPQPAEEG
ncbi:MAG TPA: single-stranded DNA-binding protein [Anaerolineae bacterium]|nr:single-stranded DNA-binding protein [Anaerolineae bacterium]